MDGPNSVSLKLGFQNNLNFKTVFFFLRTNVKMFLIFHHLTSNASNPLKRFTGSWMQDVEETEGKTFF